MIIKSKTTNNYIYMFLTDFYFQLMILFLALFISTQIGLNNDNNQVPSQQEAKQKSTNNEAQPPLTLMLFNNGGFAMHKKKTVVHLSPQDVMSMIKQKQTQTVVLTVSRKLPMWTMTNAIAEIKKHSSQLNVVFNYDHK